MFDVVGPIVMSNRDVSKCPACGTPFTPKRSNQTYCSRPCQRRASRNNARGDRTPEYRAMSQRHKAIIVHLGAKLYGAPPRERLGVMKHILDCAAGNANGFRGAYVDRVDSEGQPVCAPRIWKTSSADLRRVLTDPRLLKEPPRACERLNIAKAANAYVTRFFGMSIASYLKRVRAGEEVEAIEVFRGVHHGSVPRLRPRLTAKNVKCWHKMLPDTELKKSLQQHADDCARVGSIVAEACRRLNQKETL